MMFPLESLTTTNTALGMLIALLVGFAFGFVLERSGFGRADKLAAQFYLYDMTVFKVMFSAIVTAMLGIVLLSGVGLVSLPAVLESAPSATFIWPMLVGGLVLGAGFIVSGYCPGTSLVASASGKVDGMMTFAGVVVGSVLFGEIYPWLARFHASGAMGQRFLDQVTGIPRPVLALGVAAMAVACFFGAEKVERIFRGKRGKTDEDTPRGWPTARKVVFASIGGLSVLSLATLALPGAPRAAARKNEAPAASRKAVRIITPAALAHRMTEDPWKLRILDLRKPADCTARRIPGSECVPASRLKKLNLGLTAGARDLILAADRDIPKVPAEALAYKGNIFKLKGGFAAWRDYALTPPAAPAAGASASRWKAYRFRAAFHRAMTGRKTAVVRVKARAYVPRKKKKRKGGCS